MLSKWKAKAIVQKGISYLPKREKINFLFQKYITKGVYLTDDYFRYKMLHAKDHLTYYEKYGTRSFSESNVLELGTGWYPIIPIAFYLNDFEEIWSIDIQSWLTKERQLETIAKFIEWREKDKLENYLSHINESRWETLTSLLSDEKDLTKEVINSKIGLATIVGDARQTRFLNGEIDFICSNNTFEHVNKQVLIGILQEFIRILKPDGLMSHFIDMTDHFAHFDNSITIYNFLRYSEGFWSLIDNNIQPQNRLRFKDYKGIYEFLKIPITEESFELGNLSELKKITVHEAYASYTLEELAISHCYLVSKYSI